METAGRFGIDADRAVDYVPDGEGTELNYSMMSETVATFRECGAVPTACLDEIRKTIALRENQRFRAKNIQGEIKNEARRDQKVHRGNAGCGGYAGTSDEWYAFCSLFFVTRKKINIK